MGSLDNQGAMDQSRAMPTTGGAGSLGASSDLMNDYNAADTLGADESVGQVDATDQNELEWNAGAQPSDRMDTSATRGDTMSDMAMNAGNTQSSGQESIADAFESGDIQRGQANLNPTNAGTPATPVHDPFDQSQTADHANDPNYAKDPVCGMWVDKRTARNTLPAPVNMPMDTLYFCSAECKQIFEENPAKFGSNF